MKSEYSIQNEENEMKEHGTEIYKGAKINSNNVTTWQNLERLCF